MRNSVTKKALTLSGLAENPKLRSYLKNVRDWHGYIRFLGLPDFRDNPDVLIDRLFVEPLLTRRQVSPDEDPSSWLDEAETVFDVLKTERLLVILGDPGAGKSTLLELSGLAVGSAYGEQMEQSDRGMAAACSDGTQGTSPSRCN